MPVTKTRTTRRQTASVVSTSIESYDIATNFKTVTHSRKSSGKMLEGWSLPSPALMDSPQNWVPGRQALFLTPKSPSPKRRVTRRSSVYIKQTNISKSQSPGRAKMEFKVPLSLMPNLKVPSPGISTRTRRSSVYKKGSTQYSAVTIFQLAEEFKTKSPTAEQSSKGRHDLESKLSLAYVQNSRKRNKADAEKEETIEKSAAKRRRNQVQNTSPKSPQRGALKRSAERKSAFLNSEAMSNKARTRQTTGTGRVRKERITSTSKAAGKKTTKQSPAQVKKQSSELKTPQEKWGRVSRGKEILEVNEGDIESSDDGDSTLVFGKTQKKKRKVHSESPAVDKRQIAPQKAKLTPRSSTKTVVPSPSRSVRKSSHRATSKDERVTSSVSPKKHPQKAESADPSTSSRHTCQEKVSSAKKNVETPKSELKSRGKSGDVSSTKKSASKSLKKSYRKSTQKAAKKQILHEDAADSLDGSFLQLSKQETRQRSPAAVTPKKIGPKSVKPQSLPKTPKSADYSAEKSSELKKRQMHAESKSLLITPDTPKGKSPRESASKSKISVSRSTKSDKEYTKLDSRVLDGSCDQISLQKTKIHGKISPKPDDGKTIPAKSDSFDPSSCKLSLKSRSDTKSAARDRGKKPRLSTSFTGQEDKIKTPQNDLTPQRKLHVFSASSVKKSSNITKSAIESASEEMEKSTPKSSKRVTPNPKQTSTRKLKTTQKSASSVKRLNLSPKRTPRATATDTSTPKSTGKNVSLRKSLLLSLQKSASLSRSLNDDSFSFEQHRKPAIYTSTSFAQHVRKSRDTVEEYGSVRGEEASSAITHRSAEYLTEEQIDTQHTKKEEFGEWADEVDANNSYLSQSDVANQTFATSTYSNRCAIL